MTAARDAGVVTIKVPFTVRKRGGRKLVLAPDGAPTPPAAPRVDSTLVKAIARAFWWQRMLETGRYATIKEIARSERINPSSVSRVLRLTLLVAGIVEAILHGRQPAGVTVARMAKPFDANWRCAPATRAPPMHYVDKSIPAVPEGSRLDAKRGSRLDAN